MKNKKVNKVLAIALCSSLMLPMVSNINLGDLKITNADENKLDLIIEGSNKRFSDYYNIRFKNTAMIRNITNIFVNDVELEKVDNQFKLKDNSYYTNDGDNYDTNMRLQATLKHGDKVKFKTDYAEFTFTVNDINSYSNIFLPTPEKKVTSNSDNTTDTNDENNNSETDTNNDSSDEISIKFVSNGYFDEYIQITPSKISKLIDEIILNTKTLGKASSKSSTFGDFYYIDENDKLYIGTNIKLNSVIILKSKGKELGKFRKISDTEFEKLTIKEVTNKDLHVRLVGSFEAAILNQNKYDAITAATGAANANKNSNVVVEIAETEKNQQPIESDWIKVNESKTLRLEKSKIVINDEEMGMIPSYNTIDSSVTLRGVPIKAGKYKIYIEAQDELGRKAKSNELIFEVFNTENTKLSDRLKPENFHDLTHGTKKQWDMIPWNISLFDNIDKESESTVTVPNILKLWHGSHESGTYGVLGFAVDQNQKPHQTLIIENGTSLTLRNMKVLSSVNILIKDGGKLNFYDSSLYGTITVENGGKFQMNYDEFNNKFLTGSSINGQLILKDGAILESSLIYSNANNLTDSKIARKIETPVVKVEGNVTVNGKVYVRGDESPTGNSPTTGKVYTGQPAMGLEENATLTIPEGSELGLYGGGQNLTTMVGGDALIMKNNSTVNGDGKLIAIGGNGALKGKGGDAISGSGNINIKEAFLQGGDNFNNESPAGKGYTENIKISKNTNGYAKEGSHNPNIDPLAESPYWKGNIAPGEDTTIYNPLEASSTVDAPKIITENSTDDNTSTDDNNSTDDNTSTDVIIPLIDNNTTTSEGKKHGWFFDNNNWMYYDENSTLVKDKFVGDYYVDKDGIMIKNQWLFNNNNWYWINSTGKISKSEWVLVDNKWYYADENGVILLNQWVFVDNKWYWANQYGRIHQSEWVLVDNKWYYSDENGVILLNQWEMINGKWYHFNENGDLSINTTIDNYKVNSNGEWIK